MRTSKSSMKISVVIRSHNEAPRLRVVLASLEDQPGLDEVVVVDDGSFDDTAKVIAEASRRLPLRGLHHVTAAGRSVAANAGAQAASGDIVIFLDGDMIAGPGLIAAHRARHAEEDDALICRGSNWHLRCTRTLLDPENGIPFPAHAERHASLSETERNAMRVTSWQVRTAFDAIAVRAQKGIYPGFSPGLLHDSEMQALSETPECPVLWAAASGSNQSVRRADFLAIGGFDACIDINEHRELARRLVLAGARMAAVPAARVYHLVHRSGWRDPMIESGWEERFWNRHPAPEVALLPIFWASLSSHPSIPAEKRIVSLSQLAEVAARHAGLRAPSAGMCRAMMGYPERLT